MALTKNEGSSTITRSFLDSSRKVQCLHFLVYILSTALYLHPITNITIDDKTTNLVKAPNPILDELHIVSPENKDANPNASGIGIKNESWENLSTIFTNDYWGRSMNSPSSHKSYRPFTALSFRYTQPYLSLNWNSNASANASVNTIAWSPLFTHRLINIMLHSTLVEMVGRLSHFLLLLPTFFFYSNKNSKKSTCAHLITLSGIIVRILVALHPTHVEAVVNAANRPHLLSLVLTILALDFHIPVIISGLIYGCALLSCETAIFFLPAMILTWIWMTITTSFLNSKGKDDDDDERRTLTYSVVRKDLLRKALPRILFATIIAFSYLGIRHVNDWISIPDGLIRPAENPFYEFTSTKRFWNYTYVLCIHLSKSLGMGLTDWVGFSHEYGFDCISELGNLPDGGDMDLRYGVPILALIGLILVPLYKLWRSFSSKKNLTQPVFQRLQPLALYVLFMSWALGPLFPICGILKVGTFVSDRLAIPSSLASCVLWGFIYSYWILSGSSSTANEGDGDASKKKNGEGKKTTKRTTHTFTIGKITIFLVHIIYLSIKVHSRCQDWMDSKLLLESSIRACPRSAKSHLELSKVHSGAYRQYYDADKAIKYLKIAEDIVKQDGVEDINGEGGDIMNYNPKVDKYCDLHYQFATLYIKDEKFNFFEDRIVRGILCPFTMQGSYTLFQQYWRQVLNNPRLGGNDGKERYERYVQVIQNAIENERKETEEAQQNLAGDEL